MSKAFKSNESEDETEADLPGSGPSLPAGTKNYITPEGAKRLRDELHHLLHTERPNVTQVVSWAASNGDRSENADYQYGKRRLREIDRRIRFLTKRLDAAEIVDPQTQNKDQVLFGAKVKIKDEEDKVRTFQIVGIDETDIPNGKISWISPIGKALLNKKKGDFTTVFTPGGEQEVEIIDIL